MTQSAISASDPQGRPHVNHCDVTVIVAAWNAEATLSRAVQSALAQTSVRVEVIVIDDQSSDDTLAVAHSMAAHDPRVVVLAQDVNAGPAAARNRGLAHAKGRFVTPLDSDDFMDHGRLEALIRLAEDDIWDFVADDLWQINEDEPVDTSSRRRLFSDVAVGVQQIDLNSFVRGNMSETHGGRREIGFLKPLMRRSFLETQGLRYREDMRLGEDYDFYTTALLRGARFCLTDPQGYVAVVRPTSLSGTHDAAALGALVGADDRLLADERLTSSSIPIIRAHQIETLKRWAWLELIESIRARNLRRAIGAFGVPIPAVMSVVGKLLEQCMLRSKAQLKSLLRRTLKGGNVHD